MVTLGLLGALAAAGCYGVAAVLQATGARRTQASDGVDPRLLLRLAGSLPYLGGITLDVVGFALSLAALRSLPLFVVQAAVAGSLAVTALLAVRVLHARPTAVEWSGVGAVTGGLILVASAASPDRPVHLSVLARATLPAAVLLLAGLTWACGRLPPARVSAGLGVLAGLSFGLVSVAARVLADPSSLHGLVTDPALYGLAAAGLLGTLAYATALQRGTVTSATAALVAGETLGPAGVGLSLLGDRTRPGLGALAAAGFLITVAGALALARFGELQPTR